MSLKAATLLKCEKEALAEKYATYVKMNYPDRTPDFYKCQRDIELIIDAYVNDIKYNTDSQIRYITSQFFRDGVLQLSSVTVEVDVNTKLVNEVEQLFLTNNFVDAAGKVKELADILVSSLEQGSYVPELQNDIVDWLNARVTCRSFTEQPVEEEKLRIILSALEKSPSKQNRMPVEITVLGPNAIAEKESIYLESHCGPDFPELFNPQLLAPLVFLFSRREMDLYPGDDDVSRDLNPENRAYDKNVYLQMGICSTILCLTAESLGLKSGYCFSTDQGQTGPLMLGTRRIEFGFGIGYPRDDVTDIRYRTKPDEGPETQVRCISEPRVGFSDWTNYIGF